MRLARRPEITTSTTLCFLLLAAVSGLAAEDSFTPVYNPELTISRTAGEIEIDGYLEDEGWRGAAKAGNFAEHTPGDQTRPAVDTEVLMTYDDQNIYVAFVCYDDPDDLHATFGERDRIFQDDTVVLCIDTFGDATTAYEFCVNPYGIQGDLFYSGQEDTRYDYIYESVGRINGEGWIAELAIPFSSLRFPDRPEQEWKVDFWRNRPRGIREQYSWAAYDRDESCWPCQWGTVRGIRDVRPGRGLELIPTAVAHQSGSRDDAGTFDNGDPGGELSLSGKYALSSDIALEGTLNPDFSQVESDAAQIDVNTKFALFYNEKRPFFQEGSDMFNSFFNTVYTRSINDPSIAGKLTGRSGRTSYALLSAKDEHTPIILPFEEHSEYLSNGRSTSNILRVKQELADQTYIGLIATHRGYEAGGSGAVAGLDSRIRLNHNYQIEMQYLGTRTREPEDPELTEDFHDETFDSGRYTQGFDGEKFGGHGFYGSFERDGRSWGLDLDYWDRSPTFRAENGFENSNNSRSGIITTNYLFRFEDSDIVEWTQPNLRVSRTWNYENVRKHQHAYFDLTTRLRKAQFHTHSQVMAGEEIYCGKSFENIWRLHTCFQTTPNNKLALGGSINYGHEIYYDNGDSALGRQREISFWVDLKPIPRLLIESQITHASSRHLHADDAYFDGYIARSKLTLQLSRELSTRIVVQYDNFDDRWEFDPLLTYRLNPFSIFYVGSTTDYELANWGTGTGNSWKTANRQYFMKLQYLFRI